MSRRNAMVAKAYREMNKAKPDLEKSFSWLVKASEKNDPEALYAVGTWYLHGRFVRKNSKLAVQYFQKAINGNNREAYYDLGICYERGVGISKNKQEAFKCYLHAALLGDKQAIYEVGRCYYYGIGVAKNIELAEIWIENAKLHGIS